MLKVGGAAAMAVARLRRCICNVQLRTLNDILLMVFLFSLIKQQNNNKKKVILQWGKKSYQKKT